MYKEKAQKYLDTLVRKEQNGKDIVVTKDFENKDSKALSDKLFTISDNHSMDSVWMFAWEMLEMIVYCDPQTEEGMREDCQTNIEPDIYTGSLVAWLAESLSHIEWVDQAMSEYDADNLIGAITIGQQLAKEEVFYVIVELLTE